MLGSEGIEVRSTSAEDGAKKGTNGTASSITCWTNARGIIQTNVEPHFSRNKDRRDAWGRCEQNQNRNRIAADILYSFLQSSKAPTRNTAYRDALLHTEAHWRDDPAALPQEFIIVLELARAFRTEIIDDMPKGCCCHIEGETVWEWLDRHAEQLNPSRSDATLAEREECYVTDCCGDVENLGFENHGFVCARHEEQPSFNIAQRLWLFRRERMDWRGTANATRNLAANVLDRLLTSTVVDTGVRTLVNGSVGDFYDPFRADFLEGMPDQGGQIPCSVLHRWLYRHL